MKKIVMAVIGVYFLAMFLIYSGLLRDNKTPLGVAGFFCRTMQTREVFLLSETCESSFFNLQLLRDLNKKYGLCDSTAVAYEILKNEGDHCVVAARFMFRNSGSSRFDIFLMNKDGHWMVYDMQPRQG